MGNKDDVLARSEGGTQSPINTMLDDAVAPVGDEAFRLLCKIIADGLPACGFITEPKQERAIQELEEPRVGELSASDLRAIILVSDQIRFHARCAAINAILGFLTEPENSRALASGVRKVHAKRMTANRTKLRTEPILALLRQAPDTSTKVLVNKWLKDGVITLDGEDYVFADGGSRIKAKSMDSKISRLRASLRNK